MQSTFGRDHFHGGSREAERSKYRHKPHFRAVTALLDISVQRKSICRAEQRDYLKALWAERNRRLRIPDSTPAVSKVNIAATKTNEAASLTHVATPTEEKRTHSGLLESEKQQDQDR